MNKQPSPPRPEPSQPFVRGGFTIIEVFLFLALWMVSILSLLVTLW